MWVTLFDRGGKKRESSCYWGPQFGAMAPFSLGKPEGVRGLLQLVIIMHVIICLPCLGPANNNVDLFLSYQLLSWLKEKSWKGSKKWWSQWWWWKWKWWWSDLIWRVITVWLALICQRLISTEMIIVMIRSSMTFVIITQGKTNAMITQSKTNVMITPTKTIVMIGQSKVNAMMMLTKTEF